MRAVRAGAGAAAPRCTRRTRSARTDWECVRGRVCPQMVLSEEREGRTRGARAREREREREGERARKVVALVKSFAPLRGGRCVGAAAGVARSGRARRACDGRCLRAAALWQARSLQSLVSLSLPRCTPFSRGRTSWNNHTLQTGRPSFVGSWSRLSSWNNSVWRLDRFGMFCARRS